MIVLHDEHVLIDLLILQGIWAGMLCGTALQTAILMYMVYKTDWKAEVYPVYYAEMFFPRRNSVLSKNKRRKLQIYNLTEFLTCVVQ